MQFKKIVKVTLLSVVAVVVLAVAGVAIVVIVVDPNHFKPYIAKAVHQSTGRTLALNGNISWKIYPNLGLNIQQLSLSNPAGFAPQQMLELNSADVSVALLPLLSKHIIVKTLAIDGLKIGLIQKNGGNNWTFTPPVSESTAGSEAAAPKPLRLEMSAFSLTNSSFSYDNLESKQHQVLNKVNFVVSTAFGGAIKYDSADKLVDLNKVYFNYNDLAVGEVNFKLANFENPEYSGNLELSKLFANKLLDGFALASKERKGMSFLDNVTLSAKLAGNKQNLKVDDFNFNFSDSLKGNLSIAIKNLARPSYAGSINLEKFDLNKILNSLNIAVNARKGKTLLNSFSYSSKFKGTSDSLTLSGFNFKAGGLLHGSGNVEVQNFASPKYSGDINLPTFSLNQVLAQLAIAAPDIANKSILNQFMLVTAFAGSSNSINLSNLRLKMTTTAIAGNLNVTSLKPLAFSENITIDQLDIADFSAVNGFRVPLKNIHLNGNSSMASRAIASLSGKQNIQVENISVLGISLDKLVAELDSTIGHSGSNSGDIFRTIGNSAQVIQSVSNLKSTIAKATVPGKRDLSQKTNLGTFSSNVNLLNGLANPSSFKLNGPSVALNGNGTVNLAQKNLNYQVNSQLLVAGINPIFKRLTFPASVQGSFNDPKANLDWGSIQQQILAIAFESHKQQVKQAISHQINQVIGNATGNNQQPNGQSNSNSNQPVNQAVDAASKAVTNAIGNLFGK